MYRYFLFFITSIGVFFTSFRNTVNPKATDTRPNILWLVTEDLSPVLPMFGDSTVETPNLSRLAAEGIRYTHCFSPSGVCAPSRAALATGMYPTRIGAQHMRTGPWAGGRPSTEAIRSQSNSFPKGLSYYEAILPVGARMHSEYMRLNGYFTSNRAKQDYQFIAPVTAWDECHGRAHWRNRNTNQPFFSIFNFEVTHESQIWSKAKDSLWIAADHPIKVPPYLPTTENAMKDIRRMYSNIKQMDFQVGQILHQLEEDGLLDNTIIFWYADHGGPLPRQKRLCYDSGLRAPLIIRFPDKRMAGTVDNQLISFVDFLPTLLSLAGIKPPLHVDGKAFLGNYKRSDTRKYIHAAADRFDEKYDMIRAVRDTRFKYLRNYFPEKPYYLAVNYREQMPIMQELLQLKNEGKLNADQLLWFRAQKDPEELFDTYTDPYELKNIAKDPAYKSKLQELSTECDRWMKATNDRSTLPEAEFIKKLWNGNNQPITSDPVTKISKNKCLISCSTPGASIGYKLISSAEKEPASWQVYTKPFILPKNTSIKIVAHRIGYVPSKEIEIKESDSEIRIR